MATIPKQMATAVSRNPKAAPEALDTKQAAPKHNFPEDSNEFNLFMNLIAS